MFDKNIVAGMKYSVVGRYLYHSDLVGYHLVGEDGSQATASKETLIQLVKEDLIVNCRIQMYRGETILRGKGINLRELPVYNLMAKGTERDKAIQRSNLDLGKLKITARLMHKSACIGYILMDNAGVERKLPRKKVMELAAKGLIANATTRLNRGQIILKGIGIDLKDLPTIQVSESI